MAKKREASLHAPASSPERHTQIARRAYELYAARGYEHGHDLEDWIEAERDIERAARGATFLRRVA